MCNVFHLLYHELFISKQRTFKSFSIDINYENDLAFQNRLIESEALRISPYSRIQYVKCSIFEMLIPYR
jgi:hypothetical protein